jgi:ParB-like nuclease family protein
VAQGRKTLAKDPPADDRRLRVADGLEVRIVRISDLREQDVNAQVLQPREFERLTENVRERGALESLPYCAQPGGEGPISIVSGHHRVRAALSAGLKEIPVLLDTAPMTRSRMVAKAIAHNQLTGSPDEAILRQLVAELESVDDLLHSGLPEEMLPVPDDDGASALGSPHADFDWRMLTFLFLPHQVEELRETVDALEKRQDLIGVAAIEQFSDFVRALTEYGRAHDVRAIGTTIGVLTRIARERYVGAGEDTVALKHVLGTQALPAEDARCISAWLLEQAAAGEAPWQTLRRLVENVSTSRKAPANGGKKNGGRRAGKPAAANA